MSWVCGRVRQGGWLGPAVKPASSPVACPVPWEHVGSLWRRAWRQEGVVSPHRYLTTVQGSSTVLLPRGEPLVAEETGHSFFSPEGNAGSSPVLVLQIRLPGGIPGGCCRGRGGGRQRGAAAFGSSGWRWAVAGRRAGG